MPRTSIHAAPAPSRTPQVVITPVSLLTLGDTSASSAADKYDAAYASVNIDARGGAYGSGMINSDPMLMLQTGNPVKISTAVATLVASAKTLDTLGLARALYECRDGSGARLSNELFNQVGGGRTGPGVGLSRQAAGFLQGARQHPSSTQGRG